MNSLLPKDEKTKLRDFISRKLINMALLARKMRYDKSYLSKVVNGKEPITKAFKDRLREALEEDYPL